MDKCAEALSDITFPGTPKHKQTRTKQHHKQNLSAARACTGESKGWLQGIQQTCNEERPQKSQQVFTGQQDGPL